MLLAINCNLSRLSSHLLVRHNPACAPVVRTHTYSGRQRVGYVQCKCKKTTYHWSGIRYFSTFPSSSVIRSIDFPRFALKEPDLFGISYFTVFQKHVFKDFPTFPLKKKHIFRDFPILSPSTAVRLSSRPSCCNAWRIPRCISGRLVTIERRQVIRMWLICDNSRMVSWLIVSTMIFHNPTMSINYSGLW